MTGGVMLARGALHANSVSDVVSTHSDTRASAQREADLSSSFCLLEISHTGRSCRPLLSTFTDIFWMGVLP